MKLYQVANVKDGSMFIKGKKVTPTIDLFDGDYLVSYQRINPKSTVKDYRACYFAKIDMLALEVGETRYDIHGMVKDHIVDVMLVEVPELFLKKNVSTKYLTLGGWSNLLDRLDLWAFTNYNIIL